MNTERSLRPDGNDFLKNIYFFHTMPEESLNKIAALCTERTYDTGDILFFEDRSGDSFFIILEGELEIWKRYGTADAVLLGVSSKGQPLGEMVLIDERPRSATVRAKTPVRVYCIQASDFLSLLSTDNAMCLALLKAVTMMVRRSNEYHLQDLDKQNRELSRAYAELKALQDELLSRERLSVIGKFSSLILHDIRNPLSALKSRVQLLVKNRDDENYLESAVERINRDISRMESLAAEFLDYARGEIRLDMEIVAVDDLFARFSEAIAPRLEASGVTLHIESDMLRPVIMDQHRMLRVLINAAENACAAMPSGGDIHVSAQERGDSLVIRVRDTGRGMSREILDNIFKPFYSASSGGTGLGMLIIKSIMEAHKGAIEVDSVPGEGTTITLSLPLTH